MCTRVGDRAHIDWRHVRDNLDAVRQNCRDRNSGADPDAVVRLYERWRRLDDEAEALRAARNANAKSAKVRLRAPLPRSCGVYSQQPLRLRCLLAAAAAAARTRTPSLALGTADRAAQPQGKLGQEERQALVAAGKQLKEQLAAAEAAAAGAEQALQREGQRLPNLTHPEARGPPARSLWSGTHHQ